jgi:hypothetical protein
MGNASLRRMLNLVGSIIMIDVAIFVLVALICWLGWKTVAHFSTGLFLAGTGLITIGALSYIGSAGRTGLFDSYYKYSKDSEDAYKRAITNRVLMESSTNFALIVSFAGTSLVLLVLFIW